MRTFLVVNPKSGNGETGRRWPDISAAVLKTLGDCGSAFTDAPMHASALTAQALDAGYRSIVSVGGDGTLNEVVNGFFQAKGGPPADATLAVVPRGTGETSVAPSAGRRTCAPRAPAFAGRRRGPWTWAASPSSTTRAARRSATSSTWPPSASAGAWTGKSTVPARGWAANSPFSRLGQGHVALPGPARAP